ncbi:hypothetical protein SESBI_49289 [Sesbania bispinosa]|nr:hypothetical protein SESBI_49289 [Sesbania bispinosa]
MHHNKVSKGVDMEVPLGTIEEHNGSASPVEEFLHMYPRMTISELHATEESLFSAIVNGGTVRASAIGRYKLKVEVFDGEDIIVFVMFDSDAEFVTGDGGMDHLPPELEDLGGKELLFKVEKADNFAFKYDDTFKVKRVCVVEEIIEHFKEMKKISTPKANKFIVPFPSLDDISEENAQGNRSAPDLDVVDVPGEAPFYVDDYLSDQAGCCVGSDGVGVGEASGSGFGEGGKKEKDIDAY